MDNVKAVILAGGLGTRMWKLTQEGNKMPKPLLPIGDKAILEHIIDNYRMHGVRDFIICGGYQFQKMQDHFDGLLKRGLYNDCSISVMDTGSDTGTGGSLKIIEPFLQDSESFLLSYGDALSDVNISHLIDTFRKTRSVVTMFIKEMQNRFGEVLIDEKELRVTRFEEKRKSWINIGFFCLDRKILSRIQGTNSSFEKDVLEKLSEDTRISYCIHDGFWECMDTEEEYYKQAHHYENITGSNNKQ